MNYWITSDTHFGQDDQALKFDRPNNFSVKIFKGLFNVLKADDVLIHLGDMCYNNDIEYHVQLMRLPGKKWLCKGNHDKKSYSWYLNHGWDFVGENIILDIYGAQILFSHMPVKFEKPININVHGHLHNSDYRKHEPWVCDILTDKHKLIALEYTKYQPIKLKTLIEG